MPSRRQLISIVSPAYNEEKNLEIFYAQICETVKDADFDIEFVIVDDGSRDRTAEVIRHLADRDSRVRGILFSRNFGAIAACSAGLHHAVGDAAIIMTSDLQEPPSNILKFVERWREGFDVVWAVRQTRDDPLLKTLYADLFYWLVRRIIFPEYPKGGTDSGIFDRAVLNVYRSLPERDSSPFYAFFSYGLRQSFIYYDRLPRVHGVSAWSFWRRIKNALDVITSFSVVPLKLITVLGLVSIGMAIIGSAYLIFFETFIGAQTPGWPSLMMLTLLVGGLQLFGLGIIASYVWRIGEHTKQRPPYIIMETFGVEKLAPLCKIANMLDIDVSAKTPQAEHSDRPKPNF